MRETPPEYEDGRDGAYRVAIVGAGHVGLVTAALMVRLGHQVVVTDKDPERLRLLESGVPVFHEPYLHEKLEEARTSGWLSYTIEMGEALDGTDVVFLCVGTPSRDDGSADLAAVEESARNIGQHAKSDLLVVEKSTVPAGTHGTLKQILDEAGDWRYDFQVASNPEFLREGTAVLDTFHPDRILVGTEDPKARDKMRHLYSPMIDGPEPPEYIETNIASAELAKHAVNGFLALKVSYINAVAQVCERVGANVKDVAHVMGSDPRVGHGMLHAGLGFGGSCFHKDLLAFQFTSRETGYQFPMLSEVIRLNDEAAAEVARKVVRAVGWVPNPKVLLLGVAFKPRTDDIRWSPAIRLANLLQGHGFYVTAVDPVVKDAEGIEIVDDLYEAAEGADAIVLCTEWDDYTKVPSPIAKDQDQVDWERLSEIVRQRIVIDGRNALSEERVRAAGFYYQGVGL